MNNDISGGEIAILVFVFLFFALGGTVVFLFIRKSKQDRKRMKAERDAQNQQE